MDGNGRWAKKRALPRIAGHHEGMKVVRKITKMPIIRCQNINGICFFNGKLEASKNRSGIFNETT